jgi:hypothetical protein
MSLRDLFTDTDHVIQTWDDYCAMCDGIEACQLGEDCTDKSAAFRYGYAQEYARQEAMTAGSRL